MKASQTASKAGGDTDRETQGAEGGEEAYLMHIFLARDEDAEAAEEPDLALGSPKMFQKRRVSSAPAETTMEPALGLAARWRTRAVWPVSSLTRVMLG